MILVFLFIIIFIFLLAIILIIFSSIKITIQNLDYSNLKESKSNYKIIFSFNIFTKFRWLNIKLDKKKIQKMFRKMHLERITIKEIERNFKFSDLKEIVNIKPKLEFLDLKIKLGLDDVILTTYAIPIICTIIAIILPHVTDKKNIKNISYEVKPVYNKLVYDVKLDATINIKIINLLNSAYKIYRSRKAEAQEKSLSYNV